MNDNNLNFNNNGNDNYNGDTYRATTNLNVAIENPQADINSATGVNIQNADSNFVMNSIMNNNLDNNSMDNTNLYNNNSFADNQFSNSNAFQDNSFGGNNSLNTGLNSNVGMENTYVADTQNNYMPSNTGTTNFSNSGSEGQSSFLPGGAENQAVNNETASMYAPTLEQNKKPKTGFVVPKELKAMIVIILILVIVVLVMPYVYDFLKESGLIITSG